MIKRIIKRYIMQAATHPSILRRRLHAIASADVLTILNLHRIAEADGSAYPPLSPQLFNDLLVFLKKHFYLTTFADLSDARHANKPRLILSFDDGYKDFVEYAVPILDKHGIRANQNVIPACIESGLPPLSVLVQDFIGKAPGSLLKELEIPGLARCALDGDRADVGLRISKWLKNRPKVEQDALAGLLIPQFARFDGFRPTPMMSLAEVRQVADVHEIGVHSYSHATMAFETDDYLRQDAEKCRIYFHDRLQLPVTIYAFPNGSCRDSQVAEVLAQGYRHVLLINNVFSRQDFSAHARFGIYGQSHAELLFRALGGFAKPFINPWPKCAICA